MNLVNRYIRGGQPIWGLKIVNENTQRNPQIHPLIVRLNHLNQYLQRQSLDKQNINLNEIIQNEAIEED